MKRLLSWLSGVKVDRQRGKLPCHPFRPAMESLEQRLNFAYAAVFMDQGALVIQGDSGDDIIRVRQSGDQIQVSANLGSELLYRNVAPVSAVKAIIFKGGPGNDHFINYTNINLGAWGGPDDDKIYGGINGNAVIFGEGGRDTLIGTSAANEIDGGEEDDVIYGLEGNDVLFGGHGQDELHGYEGSDLLFGGTGYDKLYGGPSSDFLEGGFDSNLDQLEGEWRDGIADRAGDLYVEHPALGGGSSTNFYHSDVDRTIVDSRDYEAAYRSDPASVWALLKQTFPGTVSSGLTIEEGLSFEFEMQDHGLSVLEPDWQNEIAPVDEYFAELAEVSPVESEDLDLSFAEMQAEESLLEADEALVAASLLGDEELLPLLESDSSLLESSFTELWETEIALEGEYELHNPVAYDTLDTDEALIVDDTGPLEANEALLVDVSVSDPEIGNYYEEVALLPIEPVLAPSAPVRLFRFSRW